MKISLPANFSNFKDLPTLLRYLSPFCVQVQNAINGNLSFSDNFKTNVVPVTFPSVANTNIQVAHGLGTTPTGYYSVGQNLAGSIYYGSSPVFGATFVNLKSNEAGLVANVLFF